MLKLNFPEKCEKDELLKLTTIAKHCIEEIQNLCRVSWDNPDATDDEGCGGVNDETFYIVKSLEALATLSQHGWKLLPRLGEELTLAADGIVTDCGGEATNAHEAILRLADQVCCGMLATYTMVLPGNYRGPRCTPTLSNLT